MTQSSIIGTAEDAIRGLSISSAQKGLLASSVAIAYAITYIFGVAGLTLFYKIVPRLLKMNSDLTEKCKNLLWESTSEKNKEILATLWRRQNDEFYIRRTLSIIRRQLERKGIWHVLKIYPKS